MVAESSGCDEIMVNCNKFVEITFFFNEEMNYNDEFTNLDLDVQDFYETFTNIQYQVRNSLGLTKLSDALVVSTCRIGNGK